MAYETKAILRLVANHIVLAKDLEQAYELVRDAAQTEGMSLPAYKDAKKKFLGEEQEN